MIGAWERRWTGRGGGATLSGLRGMGAIPRVAHSRNPGLSDAIPLGLGWVLQSPGDCLSFSRQDVQTPPADTNARPTSAYFWPKALRALAVQRCAAHLGILWKSAMNLSSAAGELRYSSFPSGLPRLFREGLGLFDARFPGHVHHFDYLAPGRVFVAADGQLQGRVFCQRRP